MPPANPALAALVILAACSSASGETTARKQATATAPATASAPAATGPVVVELFTSQGCSSCPPADEVVSRLVADGAVGERDVVPLAFHVDYWNDLGWADPFSRAAWTDRQRVYARALGDGRIYTPQLVVGGRAHLVGSHGARVGASITAAPAPARVDASIAWTAKRATITATAPDDAPVFVAIYEDAITTAVARGENAGASLRNDHVVRHLEQVAGAGETSTIEIDLDPSWKQLGAIAIAQRDDMSIVGSRALPPRAP